MAAEAQVLSSVPSGRRRRPHDVLFRQDKRQVSGVTAIAMVADVVKHGYIWPSTRGDWFDEPSVHESVDVDGPVMKTSVPVPLAVQASCPQPTARIGVKDDSGKYVSGLLGTYTGYREELIHVGIIRSLVRKCKPTQGGDFGFPWPASGRATQRTKDSVKSLFWERKWSGMHRPLSWLIERFWPVPGWSEEDLARLKEGENHA